MRDLIGGENTAVLKQSVIKIKAFVFMHHESDGCRKLFMMHFCFRLAGFVSKSTHRGLGRGFKQSNFGIMVVYLPTKLSAFGEYSCVRASFAVEVILYSTSKVCQIVSIRWIIVQFT